MMPHPPPESRSLPSGLLKMPVKIGTVASISACVREAYLAMKDVRRMDFNAVVAKRRVKEAKGIEILC
jgi:hypothetical protein